jgi:hypothetical protein
MNDKPQWRRVTSQSLNLPQRARGLAQASAMPADLQQFVPLPGLLELGLRGIVQSRTEPVVLIELDDELVERLGRVQPARELDASMGPRDVVLDARGGEASVVWRQAGQLVRLLLDGASIHVDVAGDAASSVLQVPAPNVEEQLQKHARVEPWLAASAVAAQTGSSIQRAGALALIARYVQVPVEVSIEGRGPWVDAVTWWNSLAVELRASIVEGARFAAAALEDELDALQSLAAARELDGATLESWLVRRDDLESLAMLVEKAPSDAGPARSLRQVLASLDRAGIASAGAFSGVAANLESERLAELSWTDPAAWWGQLT